MKKIFYSLIGLLLVASCTNEYPGVGETETRTRDLNVPQGFDFSMTQNISFEVFVNVGNEPLPGVPVHIYLDDPGSSVEPNLNARKSYTFMSGIDGRIAEQLTLPSYLTEIFLKTEFLGLPDVQRLLIDNGRIQFAYGDETGFSPKVPEIKGATLKSGLTVTAMGTYNGAGVPNYLTPDRDKLSSDFLGRINASLPESKRLPDSHPDYLVDGNEADIKVMEKADVWVTFVHEGAGYMNMLAYYVYDQNSPPQSINDIKNVKAIFPNASFAGSGGGLRSGDKVYLGQFDGGKAIGWILFANGWTGSGFRTSSPRFSDYRFNSESTDAKKKHMILLYDDIEEVLLMGFEDMDRDGGSDDDFNDAIFYVTANPIEAIEIKNVPPVDQPGDDDKDGISNTFDDYPNDPNLAFDFYYPAENQFGSLVAEDLWPSYGDFDFNDLVIDYQFHQFANPSNKVVKMDIAVKVRAIGASYRNGFGIELPVSPTAISTVTGYEVKGEVVNLLPKGIESGQSNAVIIFFEDAYDVLPFSGSGTGVNTSVDQPFVEPEMLTVHVDFAAPVAAATLSNMPFNPFIFINGSRGKEVHLPNTKPTNLADASLFGSSQDDTQPGSGKYYLSEDGLPWMLNIPESFVYPREKADIIGGYNWFSNWAVSGGASYRDWYTDLSGYRTASKLYIR